MNAFKKILTVVCFPLVFCSAIGGTHWALSQGFGPGWVVFAVSILAGGCITALERIIPFNEQWNQSHKDLPTDSIYAVSSLLGAPNVFDAIALASLAEASTWLLERINYNLWPGDWPWLPQLLLAVVVAEFGSYWWHRLMHESSRLFRLHATHHSSLRLYWLNATRFHPLDNVVMYGLHILPLMILGVPKTILVGFTVWSLVHGFFQHANVDLKLGPLNYIFSMAELHRWHHSQVLEEANRNYGSNCIFWDLMFGTFFWPKDRRPPVEIGLHGLPNFPQRFLPQMLSPFSWRPRRWSDTGKGT